jgi:hypothetical protein
VTSRGAWLRPSRAVQRLRSASRAAESKQDVERVRHSPDTPSAMRVMSRRPAHVTLAGWYDRGSDLAARSVGCRLTWPS